MVCFTGLSAHEHPHFRRTEVVDEIFVHRKEVAGINGRRHPLDVVVVHLGVCEERTVLCFHRVPVPAVIRPQVPPVLREKKCGLDYTNRSVAKGRRISGRVKVQRFTFLARLSTNQCFPAAGLTFSFTFRRQSAFPGSQAPPEQMQHYQRCMVSLICHQRQRF